MKRILISIFFTIFFVSASHAEAARLYLEAPVSEVGVGQRMEITLRLDTEGETVNALEGTIRVPGFMSVEVIRDGDSLVALWSERPTVGVRHDIIFSGIIPGGWQGTGGLIFSFIAETESEGRDTIGIHDARVLLHDGEGTEIVMKLDSLTLRVDKAIPLTTLVSEIEDRELPEAFTPLRARDPNIFEGQYFLVFVTQDKGSGIDRYEVQEVRTRLKDEEAGAWEIAESPYLLNDQSLRSFVYVRAIDRAGNIKVALVEPVIAPTPRSGRIIIPSLVILLFITIIALYVRHREKKK